MEQIINAEAAESSTIKEINLDMNNFLNYLMSDVWDIDTFVVYHSDKDVAKEFLRFLGTFFPQIMDKEQKFASSFDVLCDLGASVRTEILNYGRIDHYKRYADTGKMTLNRIMWVNLPSIEKCSHKDFKEISFWKEYGKLVRNYGRDHF